MADNKTFQYKIVFASVAERTGSRNTVEDMKAVDTAVKRVNVSTAAWASNSSQVSDFLNRTRSSAKASETAFYDLDRALARSANTIEAVKGTPGAASRRGGGGGKGMAGFGTVMQSAGYQVQDFAVQVSAGTSAVTALGQQAPQLLGVFGPAGAIAGAAVSVAALVGGVFLKTRTEIEDTFKLVADFDEVARNYGDRKMEDLGKRAADRLKGLEEQEIYSAPDTAGDEAKQAADQQHEESIRTLIEVTAALNMLLGRQVTALEAIAEGERQRAAERQREAEREIEAENKKVASARQQMAVMREKRDYAILNQADNEIALDQERKKLEALRQHKKELQEIAKQTIMNVDPLTGEETTSTGWATNAATEAKAQIPDLDINLKAAEEWIARLETNADALSKGIESLGTSILKADEAYDRQVEAAKIQIETITSKFSDAGFVDAARTAVATSEAMVGEVKSALDEVTKTGTDQNEYNKRAVAVLQEIVKDGVITREEQAQAGQQLQQLVASFKGDNGRLIAIVEAFRDIGFQQSARVSALERDVATLKQRGNTPPPFK